MLSKSATPARIRENLDLLDFEISPDDIAVIAGLDGDPSGAPSRTVEANLPAWVPVC